MENDSIQQLFNQDNLLARAMDVPRLYKNENNQLSYDFSIWAEEVDSAQNDKLTSISTTLLVSGERIPTYKNMGFLIDGNLAEIIHVADCDSGSNGDIIDGTFSANATDLHSLSDLAAKTRSQHLRDMNEVNINIKDNALVGLFVNKCPSPKPLGQIILAQEYYKLHTGKELPIYIYDAAKGNLSSLNLDENERKDYIAQMNEEKKIYSSIIGYELYSEHTHENKQANILPIKNKAPEKISATEKIRDLQGLGETANPSQTEHKSITADQTLENVQYSR